MNAMSGEDGSSAPRTAEIQRRTGETEVRLRLELDGTGLGTRQTGVGFLDHMLDLLARHGRMDLEVEASGDLQTGAHHTVEDTAIVLGQGLNEALGDRAGIARYGSALVPMDEARASAALDISGRPFVLFEADLPPGATGGFDHELTEEFLRAFANTAKLTLHVEPADRHQRAPHDRGGVQGARARAARGGRDRPDRDRGAEHEGNAYRMSEPLVDAPAWQTAPRIAVVRLRDGQPALRREGARARRRARPSITSDHDELRAADGLLLPGVGAFPAAMEAIA